MSKFFIKSICSEGMRGNIRYWDTSSRPSSSSYTLELKIGEGRAQKGGGDIFTVLVATPEALRSMAAEGHPIIADRATIVVTHYDFAAIEAHLAHIVESCNQPEWSETVHRLRRYFYWEFDGFEDRQQVIFPSRK